MNDRKKVSPDKKAAKPAKSAQSANNSSDNTWETIDATPESQGQELNQALRSVQDTQVWKDSTSGAKRMWSNYVQILVDSFQRMNRYEQEDLIGKFCIIITMGVSVILIITFYAFLPSLVRLAAPPVILGLAYWAGSGMVKQVIIVRFEQYLNRES